MPKQSVDGTLEMEAPTEFASMDVEVFKEFISYLYTDYVPNARLKVRCWTTWNALAITADRYICTQKIHHDLEKLASYYGVRGNQPPEACLAC